MTEAVEDIFAPEELRAIEKTFRGGFGAAFAANESLAVSGTLSDERIEVRVELADATRDEVAFFVAGMELAPEARVSVIEARALTVEFLFTIVSEYLTEGRWPPPHLDWREYTFEGKPVFLRGRAYNERLEKMADALLGEGEGES
ncbi:MAG: hypothetical protein H6697_00430 [Myxococcales bacterium]|nr:hypothetical protein [Myxococcales bacterium]MCB9520025.1 hypothetical protein [Myxococcales bacterium]